MKTVTSAVAVVPRGETWEPIQALRRVHDRKIDRWMPHINLLYPFRPREALEEAGPVLARASGSVASFEVELRTFRFFVHAPGKVTVWLAPEPAEPLVRLQAALQAAFPDCDDVSRFASGFTPHLSVGQSQDAGLAERLQRDWRPVRFRIAEIAWIARDEHGPFEVVRPFPMGQKQTG